MLDVEEEFEGVPEVNAVYLGCCGGYQKAADGGETNRQGGHDQLADESGVGWEGLVDGSGDKEDDLG